MNAKIPALVVGSILCVTLVSWSKERTWRAAKGNSTLRGEIVGVKDGKVLIRPVVPPKAVPISSLSKKDQEFIANWQKEEAERVATAKAIELERHMNTPLLKALKGNLQKLNKEEKLEEYDIPTPGKLSLIAVYYSANMWEGKKVNQPAMKQMNRLYTKLRRRYPHFEMVLYPLEERETDLITFMDEAEITFPTLKHSETVKEAGMAVRQPFAGTFPSLLLLDRDGKVVVKPTNEDGKPKNWTTILDEVEEAVKKSAPKDDDDE